MGAGKADNIDTFGWADGSFIRSIRGTEKGIL